MSFASVDMRRTNLPSSYQMADEDYTAECRDVARKIEEYNTAVGKFVDLGEDAEDGNAAPSPKQVYVVRALCDPFHRAPRSPPRALRTPASRSPPARAVGLQARRWSVSQATLRPVLENSLFTTATKV